MVCAILAAGIIRADFLWPEIFYRIFPKNFFDRTFYRIFCLDFFVLEWFWDLTGFHRIFSH